VTVAALAAEYLVENVGRFLRAWVRNPAAIGAVAPSSLLLARLMATSLTAGARVIELGGGTGSVTRAILESGVRPQDLYIVEQNQEFASILRRRFPHSTVIEADAQALAEHMTGLRAEFDFVISGLPLLLFSRPQKLRILSQAFDALRPNGHFHQFTYGSGCPVGREVCALLRLTSSRIGRTALNLPPAFVYRLTRRFDAMTQPVFNAAVVSSMIEGRVHYEGLPQQSHGLDV
jgi:phosphatidylethanolamine/phosphatidyl-N-methylethanolamine N-methyltransferase